MPRATKRVCLTPGCPNLAHYRGRCQTCARQAEQARGTRQERGYDAHHDDLRAYWARRINAGIVYCWRCGEHIPAGQPWDLGHDDADRTRYRGPEHVACNRATAGRVGGQPL